MKEMSVGKCGEDNKYREEDTIMKLNEFNDYYTSDDAWGDETEQDRTKVFNDEYVPFLEEVYAILTNLSDVFPEEEKAELVSERFRKTFKRMGIESQRDADDLRMHENDYSIIQNYYDPILSNNSSFREVVEAGRDLVMTLRKHSDIEMIDSPDEVPDDKLDMADGHEDEYSSRGLSRRDFR
jgi:hypothetical protein